MIERKYVSECISSDYCKGWNDAVDSMPKWISVKDRLPENASTVLAIDSDGTISSAYYVGRWHSGGDLDEDAVTHWMTLPTAPKEDEQ